MLHRYLGRIQVLTALAKGSDANSARFIVIGDTKSPRDFVLDSCEFFGIEQQRTLPFNYARLCHERSYTRKNIGYLLAMAGGAKFIVETDDDNFPREEFWKARNPNIEGDVAVDCGWVNVYSYFSDTSVYPRGFPIELLHASGERKSVRAGKKTLHCPIQQGLADDNPDVDAIYRMIRELPIVFRKDEPLILQKGQWCPYNSQNTTTFAEAFPLLYLPTYCSFRMTDIWRSFVAQRIAWECDWSIMFHAATVHQERNEHDLLMDFNDEIPGYLNNRKIGIALDEARLIRGVGAIEENMRRCYTQLIRLGVINADELLLLDSWFSDIRTIRASAPKF